MKARKTQQHTPSQRIRAWLKSHGLSVVHNKKLKIRWVTEAEATRLLGFPAPAGGVLIPYFDVNGKVTGFFRIRFDNYASFIKPIRYSQAPASGTHVCLPPLSPWKKIAADPKIPILVTEGEAKAACACAHGFPCIGFGGSTLWHERGRRELHPDLASFEWHERSVVIVFDSDAVKNFQVQSQEFKLAAAFVNAGARVKIVRLPEVTA